jgi:cytochrome P450
MAWAFRPIPFMERARREFGDVFTVRLAQVGTFVFVADPHELRPIFTAPSDRLAAGVSNTRLEPISARAPCCCSTETST